MTEESKAQITRAITAFNSLTPEQKDHFHFTIAMMSDAEAPAPKRGRPQGSINKAKPHESLANMELCETRDAD